MAGGNVTHTSGSGPRSRMEAEALNYERQLLSELKLVQGMLASLRGTSPSIPESQQSSSNEYRGLTPAEAMHVYMRKQGGAQVKLDQIISYLLAAGVSPGKPRGKKVRSEEFVMGTNLKISLRQVAEGSPRYGFTPSGSLQDVPASEITVWLNERPVLKRSE